MKHFQKHLHANSLICLCAGTIVVLSCIVSQGDDMETADKIIDGTPPIVGKR
jgi:hypothetical protein